MSAELHVLNSLCEIYVYNGYPMTSSSLSSRSLLSKLPKCGVGFSTKMDPRIYFPLNKSPFEKVKQRTNIGSPHTTRILPWTMHEVPSYMSSMVFKRCKSISNQLAIIMKLRKKGL